MSIWTVLLLVVLVPVIIIVGSVVFDAILGATGTKEPVSRYRDDEDRRHLD